MSDGKEKQISDARQEYWATVKKASELQQTLTALGATTGEPQTPAQETAPAENKKQEPVKNMIIMMEKGKEQTISVPGNFETLPKSMQRTIVREQARNTESFCHALKTFVEVSAGAYAQKADAEKKPLFTCHGALLEFLSPTPDTTAITAGMELIVRKYRWTKGKVLGNKAFHEQVMKVAKAATTRLEIINPPKEEDAAAGEDTGRITGNKISSAFKKGFKN